MRRARRGPPRPVRFRASALEALARPLDSIPETLDRLLAALVPECADACEIVLTDSDDAERRVVTRGGEIEAAIRGFDGLRRQALIGGAPISWRSAREPSLSCVVVCLLDDGRPLGTLACLARSAPPLDEADAAAIEDVASATAASIGRALLQARARVAARRSQRIASQLHQLLAASMIVAGLQREEDVLDAVARRARSVFDAEEVVVALESGPASPLKVAVHRERSRAARPREASDPPPAPGSGAPARTGQWLVAPLLARRSAARGSVSIRHRDGSSFSDDDLEVASLLAQLASSALDATELNRTIQQSEERLRVLVDTAPIGIVETDVDGGIRWWNRAAASLFSWGEDPDAPRSVVPAFPPPILDELEDLWAAAVDGREVPVRDLTSVELAGRRRVLAASAALVPPTVGREGSLLTVVEDVTDQRQLMEELRHAQRMDVIGQLSSSVAHDFNNLLTLIAGYAELILLEAEGVRTTQLARDIQSTTTRASTLTGKLLTMGRTKLPEPIVFSPVQSVGELSDVLDRIIGGDIELELVLDPTTGMIRADPDQFEQMVMNLATNARDAMAEGGSLRIAIAPVVIDADAAASAGLPPGDYVRVVVTDTGSGMDEETVRRCFEPLFTTKGPAKGTGLGLPAARRVVQESGGTIQVHSVLGEGTTFEILFPTVDEEPLADVHAEPPAREAPGTTVLLAEDDDGIRELIGRILRHNGFVVYEAESAERAVEIAKDAPRSIELLVSDVVLGGMTGGELAAILQESDPELLVVLVSGNVDAAVLEDVREGTGTFLPKPFKPSELIGVIDELRSRRATAPR